MRTVRTGLAWIGCRGWGAAGAALLPVLLPALLPALLLLMFAQPAQALHQRKVGIGLGTASSSIAGDLDGQTGYTAPGTVVLAPKPDPGTGINLYVGVTATPWLGLEALMISTKHDATHQAAPGEPMSLTLTTLLLAGRLMAPLGDSFELFGRVGLGSATVNATRNAVVSGVIEDSTFSGSALALGGGIAVYFEPVSVELSMLNQRVTLNTLTAGTTAGEIPDTKLTTKTVLLTVMVHFGTP